MHLQMRDFEQTWNSFVDYFELVSIRIFISAPRSTCREARLSLQVENLVMAAAKRLVYSCYLVSMH